MDQSFKDAVREVAAIAALALALAKVQAGGTALSPWVREGVLSPVVAVLTGAPSDHALVHAELVEAVTVDASGYGDDRLNKAGWGGGDGGGGGSRVGGEEETKDMREGDDEQRDRESSTKKERNGRSLDAMLPVRTATIFS